MLLRLLLALVPAMAAKAVIVDRTAVIVGRKPILDSDIARDIRLTAFLNGTRPDFSPASRKSAAGRLIDQELIREQIQLGGFAVVSAKETDNLLSEFIHGRFGTEAVLKRGLQAAELSLEELRQRLSWQLTVLHFIDTRFRPQVSVTDEEVRQYYDSHREELKGKPLEEVRSQITDQITGLRVNTLLDDWLADTRKSTQIRYLEKSLA